MALVFHLISSGLYGAALLAFVWGAAGRARRATVAGLGLGGGGVALNVLALVARGCEVGHVPFQAIYEVCLVIAVVPLVAYAIVFLLLGFARASGTKARVSAGLGALAAATSLLAMGGARWAGDRHLNLPPALQSVWFVPHVLVYAVAYGVLGLAGLTGLTFVILRYTAWRSPGGMMRAGTMPQVMDELGYALMAVGFAFLSMGLLFGCFWAQVAWGAWWGWDAKETWALIAWLVYLLYFHARRLPGWKGLLSAWFAFAGAAAVLVCFLLFEYLPASSLHRYT